MVCLPMVSSHGKPHTSSCTLGNQPIYFGCRQSPISSARALQGLSFDLWAFLTVDWAREVVTKAS